jgi:hypothetical protein
MLRIFITYKPLRFFAVQSVVLISAGMIIGLRFLYFYFTGDGSGHIQSLILVVLLILIGFFLGVVGLVADLISVNRQLLEKLDWQLQKIEGRITNDWGGR